MTEAIGVMAVEEGARTADQCVPRSLNTHNNLEREIARESHEFAPSSAPPCANGGHDVDATGSTGPATPRVTPRRARARYERRLWGFLPKIRWRGMSGHVGASRFRGRAAPPCCQDVLMIGVGPARANPPREPFVSNW